MISEGLMLGLQVVCLGEALYRGLWWKATYWFGAFVLTLAVMRGLRS